MDEETLKNKVKWRTFHGAFPFVGPTISESEAGLTKLEYYAGLAMLGNLIEKKAAENMSENTDFDMSFVDAVARRAVVQARAMIEALVVDEEEHRG